MPNPVRLKAVSGLQAGDTFVHTRRFSQEETEAFGDLTRDYNPVHYDARWTAAKGFKGLICHGLIVGSMICEIGGQIGWLATGMDFKFIRPVYMGDTISCTLRITRIDEAGRARGEANFTNQDGQTVCRADLSGRVPTGTEKDLLGSIVSEGDPTNKLADNAAYMIFNKDDNIYKLSSWV